MLKKFRFSLLRNTLHKSVFGIFPLYRFNTSRQSVNFVKLSDSGQKKDNDPPTNERNNTNNHTSNPNPPPNSNENNNNKGKPPPLFDDFQVKLETFTLETRKFELTPEEELLPKKTYAFFSSQQSALAKNNSTVSFNIGNLTESNLDYDIAFFMQAGDSSTNKIYKVGLILDRSVNKAIKKEIRKHKKSARSTKEAENENMETPNNNVNNNNNKANTITTTLKLKDKNFRVKLAEVQIGPEGILATCIPYKDVDDHQNTEVTLEPTIDFSLDIEKEKEKEKDKKIQGFPLQNELNRIFSLINIIKIYLGYDKIQSFENTYFMIERRETLPNEKIDELMIRILSEIERISRYLKDDFPLTSQAFIESRSLILRVLFIRRKLEKIWESLEVVNRNFKIVDENVKKLEMFNKARMCLDLINYNSERKKEDFTGTVSDKIQQPLWKKYMEQLEKIEDPVSKEKIRKEIERFQILERNSGEYHKISTYLDEVFSIPWNKFSDPYWNVKYTSKILEKNIYGLEKVKERILEMVAVNKLKRSDRKAKGFVILLHGPPGTGKTSIAKNIANSLKRSCRLISFSGVTDSYFIKGHRRTYVDSQPGVFIKEIIKSGVMNPVLILDEIDKLGQTRHGSDPYNALLEILNPEENANFVDHYLDIKVDFSHVIFILTANEIFHILEPLKNRLEIISIPGYIEEEKLSIAQNYILPQVLQENGVREDHLRFNNQVLLQIIKGWCFYENGVRELRRCLERITRKYVAEVMEQIPESSAKDLEDDSAFLSEIKEELTKTKTEKKNPQEAIVNSLNNIANIAVLSNSPDANPHQNSNANNISPLEDRFEIKQDSSQSLQPIQSAFKNLAPSLSFDQKTNEQIYEFLRKYLGPPDQDYHLEERTSKVFPPGILNILSVANHIGHVLKVECVYDLSKPDKKGEFTTSGNLKNVVQESIQIAKINAFRHLNEEQSKKASERNIHVHFMSGAQPKDGPSAGIAFCTAFLSLILEKPVPSNWSMTGELTLKGEISRIGGVNGKIIASKSLRINKIIMPLANLEEVMDLPKKLLDGLDIYFVKEYKEVFALIFEGEELVPMLKNGEFMQEIKQEFVA